MENLLFLIIVGIVIFDFIVERLLDYLNTTRWSDLLPKQVADVYEPSEYKKSQAYKMVNHKFGMLTSTFSFLLILLMLFFEGFALVDSWVSAASSHFIVVSLLFFAIIGLASELLTLPFDVYDTFVIEERFGFNKTTVKTYVLDKIKSLLLAAVLGGALLSLIMWLWKISGSYFWFIAWGVVTVISLFFTMFYSNLIVPLFNKQKPLDEGDLKSAIQHFAQKADFKLRNIYVIDGSKRSTKANAYFTGIGPKKRIVLYDTLINDLTTDEIVAVLAHEIGHYKKKHTLSGLLMGIIQTGIMLYLFSLLVNSSALSAALGVTEAKFHIGLVAFGILFTPFSFFTGILMNIISRRNEYQADNFAKSYGFEKQLISALKKLTSNNLSNLTPHPLYVFFHYSHPTLLQRIINLSQ
jgi:STE24 endopeptidase